MRGDQGVEGRESDNRPEQAVRAEQTNEGEAGGSQRSTRGGRGGTIGTGKCGHGLMVGGPAPVREGFRQRSPERVSHHHDDPLSRLLSPGPTTERYRSMNPVWAWYSPQSPRCSSAGDVGVFCWIFHRSAARSCSSRSRMRF